tara:strand:- start:168 stop:449 length:282 start_codon:yes stop_codon:yes gene_type:complete
MVPNIMAQNRFLSAREASCCSWNHFPALQGISKIDHFGTQNLFEIRPRNKRPMVPKVEPPGAQRSPKYAEKSKKSSPRAPSKAMPEKTVFLTA